MDTARRSSVLEAGILSLIVVALVAAGLLTLSQFGVGPDRPLTLQAELQTAPPGLDPADSTADVVLRAPVTATVEVQDPSVVQRLSLVGSRLASLLLIAAVLELLRRIAATVRQGGFFVADNARRLDRLALVVLVGGMAVEVLDVVARHTVLDEPEVVDRVVMSLEIAFLPAVISTGISILAEVFRQGVALRDDVEGLV